MTTYDAHKLTAAQLEAFGIELDALRARILSDIGEKDAVYIRKVQAAVRVTEVAGRALLFGGILPPLWLAGTSLLGLSKILENMELGHNVMHGQYDWMNDPELTSETFDWDNIARGEDWRMTHNFIHHTYTNVRGKDRDIGYGLLRLFPEQRWAPVFWPQPIYAFILATIFQWAVALHHTEIDQLLIGKKTRDEWIAEVLPLVPKALRQVGKDYVLFPALAGPLFFPVLTGNVVANLMRNYWAFAIIFCGHFTEESHTFELSVLDDESRGHWYWRQILGSANLSGGKLFHILSGNLSHQIEHHLFPDIPAWRYAGISEEVQEICLRYGIPYNVGPFGKQFGTVIQRIFKYAPPNGKTYLDLFKRRPRRAKATATAAA